MLLAVTLAAVVMQPVPNENLGSLDAKDDLGALGSSPDLGAIGGSPDALSAYPSEVRADQVHGSSLMYFTIPTPQSVPSGVFFAPPPIVYSVPMPSLFPGGY